MRRSLTALSAVVALLALGALPGAAGTADDPEITDPAGDANFASPITGQQADTRPASLDNADLLAVWFETAYETNKVLDPATGAVLRVEYSPSALLVHIKTHGPIHPTQPQGRSIKYQLPVTLPDCDAFFELHADASGPANDSATVWAVTAGWGTLHPPTSTRPTSR